MILRLPPQFSSTTKVSLSRTYGLLVRQEEVWDAVTDEGKTEMSDKQSPKEGPNPLIVTTPINSWVRNDSIIGTRVKPDTLKSAPGIAETQSQRM